ncbi:MAG: 6-bladed beta-propeller [Candidatus Aminicenantes bacterium]
MKVKISVMIVCLFTICLMFNCAGEKKVESEWNGSVEQENGVRVVNNPEEPFYGNLELVLEQDLSIGNEGDNNYLFYRPYGLSLDSQGNIYVMDTGNYRIQKFSSSGEYLQTIGKKGQGPGEFDRMQSFYIDGEDSIYVSSGMKIQKFNDKGEFVTSIPLASQIYDFWVSPDDFIYGIVYSSTEEGRVRKVIKINMEGKEVEEIAQFADTKVVTRKSGEQTAAFLISHTYNHSLPLAAFQHHDLIYAHSSEYSLFHLNSYGELDCIINKNEPYQSISKREKDKIIQGIKDRISDRGQKWPDDVIEQACQFPAHRPFFSDLAVDDQGRIYVRKIRSVLDEKETYEFDIFSPEGYYLYKIEIDFNPSLIEDGFVYRIKSDEDSGTVKIIRYRVKNWNQMKATIPADS